MVEFVNRFSTKKDLEIYEPAVKDVTCKLDVVDEVKIGEAFTATATVKNESSEKRTVNGHFTAILVFYTGRAARTLKDEKTTLLLEPGEGNDCMCAAWSSFKELLCPGQSCNED